MFIEIQIKNLKALTKTINKCLCKLPLRSYDTVCVCYCYCYLGIFMCKHLAFVTHTHTVGAISRVRVWSLPLYLFVFKWRVIF